jgi:hypothetical protein
MLSTALIGGFVGFLNLRIEEKPPIYDASYFLFDKKWKIIDKMPKICRQFTKKVFLIIFALLHLRLKTRFQRDIFTLKTFFIAKVREINDVALVWLGITFFSKNISK